VHRRKPQHAADRWGRSPRCGICRGAVRDRKRCAVDRRGASRRCAPHRRFAVAARRRQRCAVSAGATEVPSAARTAAVAEPELAVPRAPASAGRRTLPHGRACPWRQPIQPAPPSVERKKGGSRQRAIRLF
jgi:hypothetical protein